MITLWQAVLIALVAVLTELDGNIFGENKMREPIVTGFLVGLILGDVTKGLMLGAQMQLMWMGATAIGPTASEHFTGCAYCFRPLRRSCSSSCSCTLAATSLTPS